VGMRVTLLRSDATSGAMATANQLKAKAVK
jgi:hypothetical protein